jgi:hypothetical protein
MYNAIWLAAAAAVAAIAFAIGLAAGDPRTWYCLLAVAAALSGAVIYLRLERQAAAADERYLLSIISAALDATRVDGVAG